MSIFIPLIEPNKIMLQQDIASES